MEKVQAVLNAIQGELKAPKSQFNKVAGFHYRSCEDILEAVKPLLKKHGATLIISDDIKVIADRVYVEASATLHAQGEAITAKALAREPLEKKGMDVSQVTGASSSYARKYALNGLFCIDDAKDADSDAHKEAVETSAKPPKEVLTEPELPKADISKTVEKIKERFVKAKEKLGEEDFNYILKKQGYAKVGDIKVLAKAEEVLKIMESVGGDAI